MVQHIVPDINVPPGAIMIQKSIFCIFLKIRLKGLTYHKKYDFLGAQNVV